MELCNGIATGWEIDNLRQGWERLCGAVDAVFFVLASRLRGTEETSQQAIQKQADTSRI